MNDTKNWEDQLPEIMGWKPTLTDGKFITEYLPDEIVNTKRFIRTLLAQERTVVVKECLEKINNLEMHYDLPMSSNKEHLIENIHNFILEPIKKEIVASLNNLIED